MSTSSKNFFQDLFLILASIIGMGFVSGKEILHFFCYNKTLAVASILIFVALYVLFFSSLKQFQKHKKASNFNELNYILFGDSAKYVNFLLLIIYFVCSSSMLAGLDILAKNLFGLKLPVLSISISFVLYFVLIGGVKRIKILFSKLLPILLVLLILNLTVNSYNVFSNNLLNFKFTMPNARESFFSLMLPATFWGGNVILAINSILQTKSKSSLIKWVSATVFFVLMFLGVVTIFGYELFCPMPFLTSSLNLSKVFFGLYLIGTILALFSTLTISCHNINVCLNFKSNFSTILLLISIQIMAFLGFEFIVKYLYTFSGILGMFYCVFLWIKINKENKQRK